MSAMFSLAPLWYRHVASETGPIHSLEVGQLSGEGSEWVALAYLKPELAAMDPWPAPEVYGLAAGTGTDLNHDLACHKAISEALERWALFTCHQNATLKTLSGIDIDASSTGYAAWPGPFVRMARRRAYLEAAERWSVLAWWAGLVGHEVIPGENGTIIHLLTSWSDISVVIVNSISPGGNHTYGFAADWSLNAAVARARVEEQRNSRVLDQHRVIGESKAPLLRDEQRLLFFASDEGYQLFARRARKAVLSSLPIPKLEVDTRLPGPWDRYCRVWRCLFDAKGLDDGSTDTFMF